MTQATQAVLCTQCCCPRDTEALSKKDYIIAALGMIVILGGIFLILSAYTIFPRSINAISNLGAWGYALGYVVTVAGVIGPAYSLWKLMHQRCVLTDSARRIPSNVEDSPSSVTPSNVADGHDTKGPWEEQIEKAKKFDTPSGWTGWKRGPGEAEVRQTFHAFEILPIVKTNIHRNSLRIILMDKEISEGELQVFNMIPLYIKAIHGIEVITELDCCLLDTGKRKT